MLFSKLLFIVNQYCLEFSCRKARRRDKELCTDEPKLYLEESVLENKLPDITFRSLIELPSGIDYNEWLASHSKYKAFKKLLFYFYKNKTFCHFSYCNF